VSPEGFDWQVPGLREELVTALLRSLPKDLRRAFVPVPDHVAAFLATSSPADGPLLQVLARSLSRAGGVAVRPRDFDLSRVPDHLRMTFRVVTERGRPLAWSTDLVALRAHLQARLQATISDAARATERTGIRRWDLGTVERVVTFERGGHRIAAYPALVDEGPAGVALRTLPTEAEQRRAHWLGVRRLLLLGQPSPVRAVREILAKEAGFALAHAPEELADDCVRAAVDVLMAEAGGPAWDEAAFESLRAAVRGGLPRAAATVAADTGRILGAVGEVEARLDELATALPLDTLTDVRVQLARLVHPGFVSTTGAARLPDVLRYVRGILHRLSKLPVALGRDREQMRRVQALEEEHEAAGSPLDVFWMLQELRVATFAQALGTRGPASEQKIRRELARRS
jgi:ATP-dependent helicase HrpA